MQLTFEEMAEAVSFESIDEIKDEIILMLKSAGKEECFFEAVLNGNTKLTKPYYTINFFNRKSMEIRKKSNKFFVGLKNIYENKAFLSKTDLEKIEGESFTLFCIATSDDLKSLESPILTIFNDLDKLTCGKNFGCCDKYMQCSDSKKCVSNNPLYAHGCAYNVNLVNGRIFYGKNKNSGG